MSQAQEVNKMTALEQIIHALEQQNFKEMSNLALIKNLIELQKTFKLAESAESGFYKVFTKIAPKKIPATDMYGSVIPSTFVNELLIVFAKDVNGEPKPDEQNVLLRMLLSERTLGEALFNSEKYSGEPVNIACLQNLKLPSYKKSTNSLVDSYNFNINETEQSAKDKLNAFNDKIKEATELGATKLTKANVAEIEKLALEACQYIKNDHSFEFELLSERVAKNSLHLRSELISSVINSLTPLASALTLDPPANDIFEFDSPLAAFFAIQHDPEINALVKSALAEQGCEFNKLTHHSSIKNTLFDVTQGNVRIGKVNGSTSDLWGVEHDLSGYIKIDISFSGHEINRHGDDNYDPVLPLLSIEMSHMQFTSMLQGSLAEHWEKATLSRLCSRKVARNEDTDTKKTKTFKCPAHTDNDEIRGILEKIVKLAAIAKNKETKEKLLDSTKELAEKLATAYKTKRDDVNNTSLTLLDTYRNETICFVEELDDKFGHMLDAPIKSEFIKLIKQ